MRNNLRLSISFVTLFLATFGLSAGITGEEFHLLDTRDGVRQGILFIKVQKPVAPVILVSGGSGNIDLDEYGPGKPNNFLVAAEKSLPDRSLML